MSYWEKMHRKSSTQIKREKCSTNLSEYSFYRDRIEYEKFLYGYFPHEEVVENKSDFWIFVNKYESMLRNSGNVILPDIVEHEETFTGFSKRLYTYLQIEVEDADYGRYKRSSVNSNELLYKMGQFREIVLLYLDFKQKEKFQKLRKLRKTQKSLPIFGYKEDIIKKVKNHQVIILAGDTGCGKSTQVPQYLNAIGYKNVACTQPRRLACVSLSKRVAHEMLEDYGSKVGYQIRFERNKTSKTEICFITEGLLLRQLALDVELINYDVLILDEIHERNLHGDILLGVAKCLLKARPELKLILMSATINAALFESYFEEENSAYIEVPGRLYTIKLLYMPPPSTELKQPKKPSKSNRLDPEPYVQILSLIDQKYPKNEKGDLLIFLSGVNEITTVIEALKQYNEENKNWIILPLHSGLSLDQQDKVFDYPADGLRKCVVSTNIAETSLTIDGIRFVADSGKMKEMSYDSSCKIRTLKEFWVSKSSAEQRKGRAGRTGPGVCYRLYSEKEFQTFTSYPTPEIQRVPLESILLQMIAMGLPDVRIFPFIESPPKENIEHAILMLKQHDAITCDEKTTPLGRSLSALPVEISIGKMLLMGCVFEELLRILTFAAAISVQSPFTNRAFTDLKCERARDPLVSDHGDPFTLINVFREWLDLKLDQRENSRKWCYTMGIEEQRFYEITKLRNQFENILKTCNIIETTSEENLSSTERAIRHGEVRMLKAKKRAQKMEAPKRKKIIRYDFDREEEEFGGDTLHVTDDLRDVDFRLSNDSNQLKKLLKSAILKKHKDILILKLIVISGLYPQIAIPDEYNFGVPEHQQFFHTSAKPFVSLHPNSDFGRSYDKLKLSESDLVEKPPYYTSKLQLSRAHQILSYQNLLETTKPYLLNTIRVPAAPALLLFSFTIDTDELVTRIVCDSWLCLEFPIPGSGQELLLRSVKLRRMWQRLLYDKLEESSNNPAEASYSSTELLDDLLVYFTLDICYTIKRLLPADLKFLYNNKELNEVEFLPNPFDNSFQAKANLEKGGINVTENIVYGCLRKLDWITNMVEYTKDCEWTCGTCSKTISFFGISKIIHANSCEGIKKEKSDDYISSNSTSTVNANQKEFYCLSCKRKLYLTSIEILKHKRKCEEQTNK